MAQSVRISDAVYELAQAEAGVLSRSLAQQIEHWARLGMAAEAAGLTMQQVVRALGGDADAKRRLVAEWSEAHAASAIEARHRRNAAEVAAGLRTPESLVAIPKRLAKKAKLIYPRSGFEGKRSW
jgi:hypothetical protein